MELKLSLTKSAGVNSLISDGSSVIAAWTIMAEDELHDIKKLMAEPKTYPLRRNNIAAGAYNFSNMNIEKETPMENFKAHKALMISNLASSKTGDILKQYFLIDKKFKDGQPKETEDIVSEIKDIFFSRNMKSLPIPIKTEWEEYFWEEVEKSLSPLNQISNPPMAGYVMSLPDLTFLSRLIETCHTKSEYKKYKGRVPNIAALLSIGDIKGLDLKDWKAFMANVIVSKEEFEKNYSVEHQNTIVRAFELFGNTKEILNSLNELHSASLRTLNMKIRNMAEEGKKKQYKNALSKVFTEYSNRSNDLISVINNFDDLFEEHNQNIKSGNWKAIEKYLATIIYDNVAEGCRDLAITCGKVSVSKEAYPEYQELYLDNIQNCLTAPKEYPTITGIVEGSKKNTTWETIDMSDPRAWVVGLETHCCQHLGSVGGDCVRYAIANPSTSGIFRVDEKGKTIAQSFFWLKESSKAGEYILVFDNIEVAGSSENGIRDSVLEAYKSFAKEMKKYVKLFRIRAITVGTGYMETFLKDVTTEKATNENYAEIPQTLNYTDARTQMLLKEYKLSKVK